MAFGMLAAICLLLLFVNTGSLALLFTVRREIFTKIDHLGDHLWTNVLGSADQEPELETEIVGTPNRAQICSLALRDASPQTENPPPRSASDVSGEPLRSDIVHIPGIPSGSVGERTGDRKIMSEFLGRLPGQTESEEKDEGAEKPPHVAGRFCRT